MKKYFSLFVMLLSFSLFAQVDNEIHNPEIFGNELSNALFEIIDTSAAGLNQNEMNTMSCYPNPFSSFTTIKFENETSGELVLYDLLGNMMWTYALVTQKEFILYKDNLPKGVYLLQFYEAGKMPQVLRLVIE
ncbi:MAG: hypothetical protein C0592_09940 [Marinilabiliales bacterium]|nr:MAG: hypothetical protein C0592_09940 [Marinilabiliales bacterium]